MKRRDFVKALPFLPMAVRGMNPIDLKNAIDGLPSAGRMPVFFIGHGSPMNALEDNEFTAGWERAAASAPRPKAILCISAHWLTRGIAVTAMPAPRTIHDFGGFPPELFAARYPAPGDPALAERLRGLIRGATVRPDLEWGLDHGAWSVLMRMYPDASIPVVQMSLDYSRPPRWHYELGRELAPLRNEGVLIVASGDMVHNLRRASFVRIGEPFGYDWALEAQSEFNRRIRDRDHAALIDYASLGAAVRAAVPTPDHYYPLLYALALQEKGEDAAVFNDKAVGGSVTMTSLRIG